MPFPRRPRARLVFALACAASLGGCNAGGRGAARGYRTTPDLDLDEAIGGASSIPSAPAAAGPRPPTGAASPSAVPGGGPRLAPAAVARPVATGSEAIPVASRIPDYPPRLAGPVAGVPAPPSPAPAIPEPSACGPWDELTVPEAVREGLRSGDDSVPPPAPPGLLAPMRLRAPSPTPAPAPVDRPERGVAAVPTSTDSAAPVPPPPAVAPRIGSAVTWPASVAPPATPVPSATPTASTSASGPDVASRDARVEAPPVETAPSVVGTEPAGGTPGGPGPTSRAPDATSSTPDPSSSTPDLRPSTPDPASRTPDPSSRTPDPAPSAPREPPASPEDDRGDGSGVVETSAAWPGDPDGEPPPAATPAPRRRLVRDGLAAGPTPVADAPSNLREMMGDRGEDGVAVDAAAADAVASEPSLAPDTTPAASPPPSPPVRDEAPVAASPSPTTPPPAASTAPPRTVPHTTPAPAASRPAPPVESPESPESPEGFRFAPPRARALADHAAALRRAPDDASRACWPADLVRSAPASTVLSAGDRPAIVVFYDDTARASRLAAADLLPVVAELEGRVDLVLVDLTPGRKLGEDERKLVRRYYLGYVPTTVVLSAGRARDAASGPAAASGPGRAIRLLKSERVDPALVRAAASQG